MKDELNYLAWLHPEVIYLPEDGPIPVLTRLNVE